MARPVKRRRSSSFLHYRLPVIRDVWGEPWHVADRRPTPYGFAIYMGWSASPQAQYKGGKAAVIVTAPLAKHIRAHLQRPYALPLPIGDNALRRVRKLLGVDHRLWIDTRLKWWLDRIDDLGTLSAARFVAKHGKHPWTRRGTMSTTLVWQMRVALLGRHRRPVGWWKAPAVQALVLSNLSLDAIAERLQISRWTVYGIRYRVLDLLRGSPQRSATQRSMTQHPTTRATRRSVTRR